MWPLLIALVIVSAVFAWRLRAGSRLDAQWKRDVHALGFRADPNVSPTEMVRDRHMVRMSWSPVNGRPCLEIAARLAQPLPFRMFASTDADRDLLVPLLPRMKFSGFTAVASDDQPRATRLLELAHARLLKLGAQTTVEVTESAAKIRLVENAPAERIGLALKQSLPEADLRWSGSRYEGKTPLAGGPVTVLYCDAVFAGDSMSLGGLKATLNGIAERLETTRAATARRLLESHSAWFDGARPDAAALKLDTVRLSHATKDVTLYLTHQAVSGHFVEVVLAPDGTITSVDVMG